MSSAKSKPLLAAAAALALACLFLYWPATGYEFVDVDDPQFVRDNEHVREGLSVETIRWAFSESHASNWLPFTFLSLALDSTLFGNDPGPYHRTNIILHALAAVLLLLALHALTDRLWLALIVAALWALHPLRVESVAWIAERKDVLSGAFGFASLWSYALYARERRRLHYWLCGILLLCGLLAKAMLVTWPFVFLLLDRWPLERSESIATRIREKIPFFLIVAMISVATFVAQRGGGAVSTLRQLSLDQRLANALISYVRYLGDLFWPIDLAYLYPHPAFLAPDFGWPTGAVLASGFVLLALTAALWLLARRGQPAPWTGWLFYLGTLVPVLGILQVGIQSKADRYSYLPHLGLLVGLVFALGSLAQRGRSWRRSLILLSALLLMASAWQSRRQLAVWADSESLFRHAVEVTENNAYAHNGLGAHLGRIGQYAAARPQLEQALRVDPNLPEAHLNLGIVLSALGELDGARSHYERARTLDPASDLVHLNLGMLLATQGELSSAESSLQRARQLGPARWQTELNLALVQMALGRRDEALDSLRRAQRLNPSQPTIRQKWMEWNAGGP